MSINNLNDFTTEFDEETGELFFIKILRKIKKPEYIRNKEAELIKNWWKDINKDLENINCHFIKHTLRYEGVNYYSHPYIIYNNDGTPNYICNIDILPKKGLKRNWEDSPYSIHARNYIRNDDIACIEFKEDESWSGLGTIDLLYNNKLLKDVYGKYKILKNILKSSKVLELKKIFKNEVKITFENKYDLKGYSKYNKKELIITILDECSKGRIQYDNILKYSKDN